MTNWNIVIAAVFVNVEKTGIVRGERSSRGRSGVVVYSQTLEPGGPWYLVSCDVTLAYVRPGQSRDTERSKAPTVVLIDVSFHGEAIGYIESSPLQSPIVRETRRLALHTTARRLHSH